MGLVKGVVKGTLGALKTAVWNPVKSLLGKVGFDADKFGKDVASSYTSTRDAGRKSQMNRYNKKKAAVYNDLRQARLEDAATAHEQKGQEVSKAAGELQTAVDNENAAAKPVEEASGNAATAAMGAAGANANVDNDTRVQTPQTDQAIDDLTEKRDDLISKNQAITKAYGSKEEMEAVVAATKGSNPAKYKEVKHALDTYNKNEKAINDTRADLATAKTQKAEHTKMVDTFSGKNAELEKLGITSETSFSDAKKIVAKSGSKELQDMFAKDNAKDMFENSNVKTARGANAEARRTQTELKDAQSKYNAAHDARVKKQEALTEKVGEMGKASALVNSLADTIEDANQVAPAENKYKRNFQKVEKGPVKDKVKNKRSAAAKAVSDGSSSVQDAVSGGTKSVMDNVAAMSGPKTISTVGELKAFATQKTAEARAKTAEAESKLDDFVAKNASMEITDISKSKPNHPVKTTLGEYVKNAGGSTGAVLNRLQSGLMNDERGKVFTPELTGLMDGYNTARANQRQATSNATHAAGAVGAMASVSASNVRRMEGIQTQYAETVERGKVINKVIASGGKDITEADRKVIGETLGMRGGSLKATSEKTIVERAKEAREKNTQRQVDLVKKADGVMKESRKMVLKIGGRLTTK